MTEIVGQARITEVEKINKIGEKTLKPFLISKGSKKQVNIKQDQLLRNLEESSKWIRYLCENESIESQIWYLNKPKDMVLQEATEYIKERYRLNYIVKENENLWATKEKCLDMLSKIGFCSKDVEIFKKTHLTESVNKNDLDILYLSLAGLWDALISNFEEMLEAKLKNNGVKGYPGYVTNQVPILNFFLRNFEVIDKYTEFFKNPWFPDSLKFYKNYAVITLTECSKKGLRGAIEDKKVKKIIDEFVRLFVKSNNEKMTVTMDEIMPRTEGTYDMLKKMTSEIIIPWQDENMFDPTERI